MNHSFCNTLTDTVFTFVWPKTENSPWWWWTQSGGISSNSVQLSRSCDSAVQTEKSWVRQVLIVKNEEFHITAFHSQGAAAARTILTRMYDALLDGPMWQQKSIVQRKTGITFQPFCRTACDWPTHYSQPSNHYFLLITFVFCSPVELRADSWLINSHGLPLLVKLAFTSTFSRQPLKMFVDMRKQLSHDA